MEFTFPDGFYLGTAAAAHQIEGGNKHSDYWLYENTQGSEFLEPSGDALAHYRKYREDIALLADLGFKSLRMSIEWARIEPAQGEFNAEAIAHYAKVLGTCREFGIEPVVTLHHFTSPAWLIAQGGWESEHTPELFAAYASHVASELGAGLNVVCTINEANTGRLTAATALFGTLEERQNAAWVASAAKSLGIDPSSFVPWNFACSQRAVHVILNSHHAAVNAMKAVNPNLQIGITLAMQHITAVEGGEERCEQIQYDIEDQFLEALRGDDFVGVQTYTRMRVGPNGVLPPQEGVERVQLGYEFWPEALEPTIRHAIDVARIPVIVTENGIGTEDDARRIEYIGRALQGVQNCLKDGLDVRGYFCWSSFDNYEWEFGFGPKFGLIAVDRTDQSRHPKPSAYWLGNIAKAQYMRNSLASA